jgi:hypothetical protein
LGYIYAVKKGLSTGGANPVWQADAVADLGCPAAHTLFLELSFGKTMAQIKFGTSGWRGLIARDFTFDNLRLAAQGIAQYLNAELKNRKSVIYGRKPVVIIGHDTRFLGRTSSALPRPRFSQPMALSPCSVNATLPPR